MQKKLFSFSCIKQSKLKSVDVNKKKSRSKNLELPSTGVPQQTGHVYL
jgi:hypothetical protein